MSISRSLNAFAEPPQKGALPPRRTDYRRLAAEMRELAGQARSAEAWEELHRLAEQYDRLAQRLAAKTT
jgi:hypothetical protein